MMSVRKNIAAQSDESRYIIQDLDCVYHVNMQPYTTACN